MHFFSRSVSYVPRWYSSTRKNTYRSNFFMRRGSYVFYFFMRISSTKLKFTRELSRKDGTRNRYRIRYRYSPFPVSRTLVENQSMIPLPYRYHLGYGRIAIGRTNTDTNEDAHSSVQLDELYFFNQTLTQSEITVLSQI